MRWKFSPGAASKSRVTSHWFLNLKKRKENMEDCSFHAPQTTTVAVYVCSLSSRQRCGVCELEWNRICCRDNHTRGVPPSLENKCSRPITDQHAVEDARKDESPSSWQCTSFYFPLQSHSKLSTTEWFVGPGLDLTLFILHILLLQSLKIKRSEKCFFKEAKLLYLGRCGGI